MYHQPKRSVGVKPSFLFGKEGRKLILASLGDVNEKTSLISSNNKLLFKLNVSSAETECRR